MKIMLVGDVVGRTGRKAFDRYTKELRQKYNVDMVIVNGENSAGGKGISRKSMDELLRGGADVITSGNHIWDNREYMALLTRSLIWYGLPTIHRERQGRAGVFILSAAPTWL